MPAKYTKWTNIWKKLTPSDSSQLEVFLEIFLGFFLFFWIQIWSLNLGGFEPTGTGTSYTGNRGFRTGSGRKKNLDHDYLDDAMHIATKDEWSCWAFSFSNATKISI